MRGAEGGNARTLMRILRHEAGHALDNAYRLRRRKCWRDVFGPASLPYPHRYRARPGMQLLWSGIAAYVSHYDIALMFGCASLPGTEPAALAVPLSYLYYHHLAPPALRAVWWPLPGRSACRCRAT